MKSFAVASVTHAATCAAALVLLSAGVALASDDEYRTYNCNVTITETTRPMYTEKEMKTFDEAFEECTGLISDQKPEFEYVEVKGQKFTRERRRLELGGKKSKNSKGILKVKTRSKCRRCSTDTLSTRRLDGAGVLEARRLESVDFDQCMFELLTENVKEGDDELEAFMLSEDDYVNTTCELVIEHEPPIADVLHDHNNGTDIYETRLCETQLTNAPAPMLSEAEMAHFDHCMAEEYNKVYAIDPMATLMVENEITQQEPRDMEGLRRRLSSRNIVNTRSGSCRAKCREEHLSTRRRMPENEDPLFAKDVAIANPEVRRRLLLKLFNENFCACLMAGSEDGAVMYAFSGDLKCVTNCNDPVLTMDELEARKKESEEAFAARQRAESEKFEAEWEAQETMLKAAEVELKRHKDEFKFLQVEEQVEFEAYHTMEYDEQLDRIIGQCAVATSQIGRCDGLDLPADLISVEKAEGISAKFQLNQHFAYSRSNNECEEGHPLNEEMNFLVRYIKEASSDKVEYECKEDKKKCGESIQFETKHCYFDGQKMVADVEVAIETAGLLIDGSNQRRRVVVRDLGVDLCEEGKDTIVETHCVVTLQVDCSCKIAGDYRK